jgi:hypothetical protein
VGEARSKSGCEAADRTGHAAMTRGDRAWRHDERERDTAVRLRGQHVGNGCGQCAGVRLGDKAEQRSVIRSGREYQHTAKHSFGR